VHQVPAFALLEGCPQRGPGGPVLEHAQLDGEIVGLGDAPHQALELIALAAETEGGDVGGYAEDSEDAQAVGDRLVQH